MKRARGWAAAGAAGAGAGGALASRCRRASCALLLLWLAVAYFTVGALRCGPDEDAARELRAARDQLDSLRARLAALQAQAGQAGELGGGGGAGGGAGAGGGGDGPSLQYEELRRRLHENTKELWNYLSHELEKLAKAAGAGAGAGEAAIREVLEETAHRKRSLLHDIAGLGAADGWAGWRRAAAARTAALLQRRLHRLQHPPDCREARKLVCNLNKGCGFGCQLHHIVYCLIAAYASERTLLLQSRGWRYAPRGWERVFRPLSASCTELYGDKPEPYPGQHDSKVLSLPFIDSMSRRPAYLPLAVPADLAARARRFTADPAAWWVGQLVAYALRPAPDTQRAINDTVDRIGFKNPIVGVHVRRTDKVGTEAAFHRLKEYMTHVEEYYTQRALAQPDDDSPRRVYLATDDPHVLAEARAAYPGYSWLGDADVARAAATHRRYSAASLAGLLTDISLLSRADFLVCTFSSQVGRVAYEIMQTNRVDAAHSVASLDDIYYFGGQNAHDRRALQPHRPAAAAAAAGHISFETGDLIGVAGNHWNGYGRGTNRRTEQVGLFPWYKTADHLVTYPFPEYRDVPLDEPGS